MSNDQREGWNRFYRNAPVQKQPYDGWLDPFAAILAESRSVPIIELGCGLGSNTCHLSEEGFRVIACDFSEEALLKLRQILPCVETCLFDLESGLPFPDACARIVIADLCLHYFSTEVTLAILADVKRVLLPAGYLLCRLNSVHDSEYGASQGEMIESNYSCLNGRRKRFFDLAQIEFFFASWTACSVREKTLGRYGSPKHVWELVLQKPKRKGK